MGKRGLGAPIGRNGQTRWSGRGSCVTGASRLAEESFSSQQLRERQRSHSHARAAEELTSGHDEVFEVEVRGATWKLDLWCGANAAPAANGRCYPGSNSVDEHELVSKQEHLAQLFPGR